MNEAKIRQMVSEYLDKGGSTMGLTLSELKTKYPKLCAELKAEHRAQYDKEHGGSLEAQAAKVIAEQGRVGKQLKTKPEHLKSEEERAGDQIAGKARVKRK